jgi:hypothetical protein
MSAMGRLLPALVVVVSALGACGGGAADHEAELVAPVPRRTAVWLPAEGIAAEWAARLAAVGVDQLVVRRGSILLTGPTPVVQLNDAPVIEGPIPSAVVLEVRGTSPELGEATADAVWGGLAAHFGDRLPAELILDLPVLFDGTSAFVSQLASRSGLGVVPVLTVSQIGTEEGMAVARAAHGCIVPVFGVDGPDLRGIGDMRNQPLRLKLAAVRELGVRVRLAVALRPKTDPAVEGWAEDLDRLTVPENADIKRTSTLDRSFVVRQPLAWGGRSWSEGETIAVSWVDAAKLRAFLTESHRTILPDVGGWDLITMPPVGSNLGLDREELVRFLGGEGPEPKIDVKLRRNGQTLTVEMSNPSIFRSAVTGVGTWVQVEISSGSLTVRSRGSFNRVILGTVAGGEWQPNPPAGPDAVRFLETYLAPGEELKSGAIRLPSSRSRVTARWQVQLSDGSAISGVVE